MRVVGVSKSDVEQRELALEGDEFEWIKLTNLSVRERALSRELDEVRRELQEQARAMKLTKIASVDQMAKRLDRNRQRVNGWMRGKPALSAGE